MQHHFNRLQLLVGYIGLHGNSHAIAASHGNAVEQLIAGHMAEIPSFETRYQALPGTDSPRQLGLGETGAYAHLMNQGPETQSETHSVRMRPALLGLECLVDQLTGATGAVGIGFTHSHLQNLFSSPWIKLVRWEWVLLGPK